VTDNVIPMRRRNAELVVVEPAPLEGKAPPHDLVVETALLAAIMTDDVRVIRSLRDFLKPEHFYSEAHRRIFEACLKVEEKGLLPEVEAVVAQLRSEGRLAQVGEEYLRLNVVLDSGYVRNARERAESIYDLWRARQLLLICNKALHEVYNRGMSLTETQGYLERVGAATVALASKSPRSRGASAGELYVDFATDMTRAAKEAQNPDRLARALTTTFPSIDRMIGGFLPGAKHTIVGLPGGGKTVLGGQIAIDNALLGHGTMMFVTEQTKAQIFDRMLAKLTGINGHRIKAFRSRPGSVSPITAEEIQAMREAGPLLKGPKAAPLHIEHEPNLSVDDVLSRVRAMAENMPYDPRYKTPLKLVVVDYIQRLVPAGPEKVGQIEAATKKLKNLAAELDIVVVELAQQKPMETKGKAEKPRAGMVHWSRGVEQESDVVIYLWERGPDDHVAILSKSRNGEEGEVPFNFEKPYSRMSEIASGPDFGAYGH